MGDRSLTIVYGMQQNVTSRPKKDRRGAVGVKVLPIVADPEDRFQLLKAVVIIEKLAAPSKSGPGGLN